MLMAHKMYNCGEKENELMVIVKKEKLHCKSRFEAEQDELTSSHEIPKLSLEIIRKELTFGSYQLFHCPNYLVEYMSENMTFHYFSCKE
jgi:hypothetical protein